MYEKTIFSHSQGLGIVSDSKEEATAGFKTSEFKSGEVKRRAE